MASYLDDKTRAAHYDECRIKKKRYERVLDICMWASLLFGAFTVIPELFVNVFMNALFLRDVETLSVALGSVLSVAAAIYTIYLRKWPVTVVAAAVVMPFNAAVGCAAIVSAVVHFLLEKLSREEGWPLFDISYAEQEQRQKNTEKIIRHRAVEQGARVIGEAAPDGKSAQDMYDILDERRDTLSVSPSGYHDRFRNAQPEDRVNSFEPGVMDTLEALGEEQ